jgi:aminoglycoside/choline kinase family phosphotransferase
MSDTLAPTIEGLVRRRWSGARLEDLTHLAGDFSTRRYLRARVAGGDAPATLVVMVLAGSGLPLSSEELAIFAEPPRELPFVDVHRLLTAIGAPVPAIYVEAVAEGLLLLEDAGDVSLWEHANAHADRAEDAYRRAIDVLVLLHGSGTASPARTSIAFQQRFDERLYRWELDHFREYGIERGLGRSLDAGTRAALDASFDAMSRELAAADVVLSHRDFHSWNVLVRDGAPIVIDFQDALLAAAEYDLASLLTDRITPRLVDPALESRLLDYYATARGCAPVDRHRYGLTALHRALKVIGRLHYIAIEKGKPGPLAFMPDVVATARRFIRQVEVPGALAAEFERLWPER